MAVLFKKEGNFVIPTVEALMITPFSEIWERDNSPKKEIALREFAYIEFMTSQLKDNPFRDYPKNRKMKAVINAVFREDAEEWVPDSMVRQGCEWMYHMQTEGSDNFEFLQTALRARDKLSDFLDTFNPDERANEGKGSLLLKPRDITSALTDVPKVTIAIMEARNKVAEEVLEAVKIKGQKTISPFADPSSLNSL